MAKVKTVFICQNCSHQVAKWLGRCPGCGEWNTLEETLQQKGSKGKARTYSASNPIPITQVQRKKTARISTGLSELDRILGGGMVPGGIILLGGEPGVGKSTLLLAAMGNICAQGLQTLYVSGEESLQQIRMRAERLKVDQDNLFLLAETQVERVIEAQQSLKADVLVIDSVQTTSTDTLTSAPGTISQIREVATQLQSLAKGHHCTVWIVGHVTKDGHLAGPKVLEHIVDTVLYFEGEGRHPYRIIRAVKNRFGATHEVGLFDMKPDGLAPVPNPSERLLAERPQGASGTAVVSTQEGTRPVLVEVQALVAKNSGGSPRRTSIGIDSHRVSLMAAVLEKVGLPLYDRDLYVNAVGGIKINEPAADLGVVVAIASALSDRPVPPDLIAVGEVGLTGEIRGVSHLDQRLQEAARHGFKRALVPPRGGEIKIKGLEIIRIKSVPQALRHALSAPREESDAG